MALIQIRRTDDDTTISSLEFGELAFKSPTKQLYIGKEDTNPYFFEFANFVQVQRAVLNSDKFISVGSPSHLYLDPNGVNRNIYLPYYSRKAGIRFVIKNISLTADLVIIENVATMTEVCRLNLDKDGIQGEFIYDGEEWQVTII